MSSTIQQESEHEINAIVENLQTLLCVYLLSVSGPPRWRSYPIMRDDLWRSYRKVQSKMVVIRISTLLLARVHGAEVQNILGFC